MNRHLSALRNSHPILIPMILLLAGASSLSAQTPVRLTDNPGQDLAPAWDPRDGTIVYIRSAHESGSGVPFDLWMVGTDGPGESVAATGPTIGFGVAHSPSWLGDTGVVGLEERVVFHEYLTFDFSKAPFTRVNFDGDDDAFTRELIVPGGGGGGWIRFSRDGTTALWRSSTSGGSGTQEIRVGPVSELTGQANNAVGTAIVSSFHNSDQRYTLGAALSPDGSTCVLALPPGGASRSGTTTDLWLYNSDGTGTPVNLTQSAITGVNNRVPDFSPDGNRIVFARHSGVSGEAWDLYQIDVDGENLTPLTDTPHFTEYEPSFAPDGERVAFRGQHLAGFEDTAPALPEGETSNANIYIMDLPKFELAIDYPGGSAVDFVFTWATRPGVNYQVYKSVNLPVWEEDGDALVGDGEAARIVKPVPAEDAAFYKVEELPTEP